MKIVDANLAFHREPYRKPFGVKGHFVHEKWITEVQVTDQSGVTGTAQGGLAPLWSDPKFFAAYTPVGGNILMAGILERSLPLVRGQTVDSPLTLQAAILDDVRKLARGIIGFQPSTTLLYNALVALDHAAWVLHARLNNCHDFDAMLPAEYRAVLSHRHRRLFLAPTASHAGSRREIAALLRSGCRVLKVKLGSPGGEEEMLRRDEALLERISDVLRGVSDCPALLYLDINGRYWKARHLDRLVRHCEHLKLLERVCLVEEPYPARSRIKVASCPVPVAADESLCEVADVARRRELGYRAVTLKPAGKTLSLSLRMAEEAARHGMILLVGDSSTTPALFDWNRNVAARLPAFPGLPGPLIEWNGPQLYRNWRTLLRQHPARNEKWLLPQAGAFNLAPSFYAGLESLNGRSRSF